MNPQEARVAAFLKKLGIEFNRFEHPPVYTVEEAVKYWKDIRGTHCKNIFVRNKKGNRHYLIIVPHSKRIDLTRLSRRLGQSRLSFASPERMLRYLGVEPGSVSPFGLIEDINRQVRVIIDQELMNAERVNFHPNINTVTLSLTFADFEKFLAAVSNDVVYLELETG